MDNKCKNTAVVIIPWGGKILKGCEKHAHAMNTLARFTGNSIEIRSLPPTNDTCEFNNDLD